MTATNGMDSNPLLYQVKRKVEGYQAKVDELQTELGKVTDDYKTLEQRCTTLDGELQQVREEYVGLEAQHKTVQTELTQKAAYIQRQIDEVHAYLDSLELPELKPRT